MTEAKTIEISTETYAILHSLQEKLQKYLKKKVSFDALLKVILTVKVSDDIIADLSELLRESCIDKELKKRV